MDQTGLYRVLFYVAPDSFELLPVADQMIIALILPKRSGPSQDPIGFMSRKSLERSQPLAGAYLGGMAT
jgi:hypothetical protein